MKSLILSDEISLFHWTMLKSVLMVLSLLPMSELFMNLWNSTDANSQIMVGFMGISIFTALSIISFCGALKATVLNLVEVNNTFEAMMVKIYRYIPMLSLLSMMSYLATQI